MKPLDPKIEATTSTILMRAAEILCEKGWIQKCLENELGVCVHGAIFRARREAAKGDIYQMGEVYSMAIGDPEYHFAAYLLEVHQQHTTHAGCCTSWNDYRGRTREEVIAALQGAALWRKK